MITNERTLAGRSLLTIADLEPDEVVQLISDAIKLKSSPTNPTALAGIGVALLFEKPSLRTRASFEFGLNRLGAHPAYFDLSTDRIGARESIQDYAKNLERWCDAIVARVYDHSVLVKLAQHADVPVINALSDLGHPCQALADLLTLREALGTLSGNRLAFVGEGNNVCHSVMIATASVGMDCTVVCPDGHGPSDSVIRIARERAAISGASVSVAHEPDAVRGHHAVYTDTWYSMGDSAGATSGPGRDAVFSPFMVNEALMNLASHGLDKPAYFLHCLPALRGREVSEGVIDGDRSLVYEQAENRMHAQNALMLALLNRS